MDLYECREELRSIISEMRSIEDGVRCDFSGIGEDLCADCIEKIASKYDYVLRRLNNVKYNVIASAINKK